MKTKLDFNIIDELINDKEILLFMDKSEYIEPPAVPIIRVRFPGFNSDEIAPITPNEINKLTTSFLKFTECKQEFPDGLYHITYSIAPHDSFYKCKWYLRTVNFYCNMNENLKGITLRDKDKIEDFYKLDKLIFAAKAQVETNPTQANELFKEAQKQLSKIRCVGVTNQ